MSGIAVACGTEACQGVIRLGNVEYRRGVWRFQVLAKGSYDLPANTGRRIPVRLSRTAVKKLRGYSSRSLYMTALAGPPGTVEAKRGQILVRLAGRSRR